MLVNDNACHSMFIFMDDFSNCNEIKIDPCNAKKTTFRTPMGNFHYTVMHFGVKNTSVIVDAEIFSFLISTVVEQGERICFKIHYLFCGFLSF